MENTRAPQETPLPPCLLLGSSRNSRMSQRSGGVSYASLGSEMFYRNAADIIGPCRCQDREGPDSDLRETPTQYNASPITVGDDHFEFDGPLTQLTLRFDKRCLACGELKL